MSFIALEGATMPSRQAMLYHSVQEPIYSNPQQFLCFSMFLFADFVKGSMSRPDVVSMAMSIQNGPALDSLK
jgi:hypothetical protein